MRKRKRSDSMIVTAKVRTKSWERIKPRDILLLVVMSVFALLMVSPVLWMLSASFQNQAEMFQASFAWIPPHLRVSNYVDAWVNGNLGSAFLMSLEVVLLYVPAHVLLCTLTGYVFAKFQFRGKQVCFLLILATMLIPQETTY